VPAITSGGAGGCRSRGNRDAEPGQPNSVGRGADEDVCWFNILVDQAGSVDMAERRSDPDGELHEASDFHGRADTLVERLAAGVFEHEQGSIVLAHELQRPRRPGIVQVFPQRVFMSEPVEAGRRVEPRGGKYGEHRRAGAVGANPPSPAENTLLILRKRLEVIAAAGEEPQG